jgi:outer membrane protein OmpA-like peptidoglycan-associated protein
MLRQLLFFVSVSFFCFSSSFAQPEGEKVAQFGVFANGGLNMHTANFQTLPGVPSCCPRYENGSGLGIDIGIYGDLFLASLFSIEMRFGYSTLNATLKADEFTTVAVNDLAANGIFEHTVKASIGMISFSPMAVYNLSSSWRGMFGPQAGYITSNTFSEQEALIQPQNNGTFENGSRIRNQYSGATPDASHFYFGLTIGTQYTLPFNKIGSMFLLPEAFYTYGLTPLVKGMSWRANSFQLGVAFRYDLYKEIPPPPPPTPLPIPKPKPVALKPPPPVLRAGLSAAMIDTDGIVKPLKELVIEDYIRTQYRPLLNFVFFDKGSAELSYRYHTLSSEQTNNYNISKLNEFETLPLYYEMLNIVGKRMKQYPKARITIVGCNDDNAMEKNNRTLSRSRAEKIFSYFQNVWQIEKSRMGIEVRSLPEKPSSVSDSDGTQENRRVEIQSNNWHVLEPVFTTDTVHIPKPAVVRYIPAGIAETGIHQWEVAATENRKKLKDFSGKDTLPGRLDWELEKEQEETLASLDTVNASLSLTDKAGQAAESPSIGLPVRHYTLEDKHREGSIDTIISTYSLILFDFDKSELSEANRRIADFVKDRISDIAKVSVFGYTDRIGTDEYNRQLSELRAQSTQRYIGLERAEVKGYGRRFLLYDNSLPEGRFYSRTVTVIVSTPTKR